MDASDHSRLGGLRNKRCTAWKFTVRGNAEHNRKQCSLCGHLSKYLDIINILLTSCLAAIGS